jgi:PKD repeat protein
MRCKKSRVSKYPAGKSRFLFVLLIAILILCSTAIGTVVGVETLQVTVTASPASVSAGSSAQILVTATYYGQPLSGATVIVTSNTGSATLTPSSSLTDSSGHASFRLDTASSTSGTVRVSAIVTKSTIDNSYQGQGYADIPVQPVVLVPLEPGMVIITTTTPVPQPYQPPAPQPHYQPPVQPGAPQIQPQSLPGAAQPPVAVISVDNYAGNVPLNVTFDGTRSYAPGGSIVTYAWDFGDGSTGTGYIAQHQYTIPGTYTASLVVTDNTMVPSAPAAVLIYTVSSSEIPINETGGDLHFIVNTSSGTVVFGNGSYGFVPETGADNISAGYYRAGGNGIPGLIYFTLNPLFFPVWYGIENGSQYLEALLNRPGPPPLNVSCTTAGFAAQTYRIGVDGVTFRQDPSGVMTIEINYQVAQQAGAVMDINDTYITVYQKHPYGVLLMFHGDRFTQEYETISGRVTRAEFKTDPLITNMSYGIVGGSLNAEMFSLPKDAQVDIVIREKNDAEVISRFNDAAERNGLKIDAIAYTFDVTRRNFNTTGAANISLTIPVSWVDRHGGKDSVRIARNSGQTGPVEFLRTSYTGPDGGGNLIFSGISPNGTSVFGLITAHEISAKQQEGGKVDIFPGSMPAVMTDIGMLSWLLGLVLENPLATIGVTGILGTVVFMMWFKR